MTPDPNNFSGFLVSVSPAPREPYSWMEKPCRWCNRDHRDGNQELNDNCAAMLDSIRTAYAGGDLAGLISTGKMKRKIFTGPNPARELPPYNYQITEIARLS